MGFFEQMATGLGAGLFSSIGNMFSSNSQYKAARDTNLMNYKIWQEQKQHNYDIYDYQFDKEANYNDPSAVRERLEKAGFNPYLMFGDAATAPSAGIQASTPPTMQSPPPTAFYNPLSSFADTLSAGFQAASTYADIQKKNADTKKTLEDTVSSWLNNSDLRYKIRELNPLEKLAKEGLVRQFRINNDFMESTSTARSESIRLENDYKAAQTSLALLQGTNVNILNKYLDEEKRLGLAQQAQLLHNLKLAGIKTVKEIHQILANTIKTQLESQGVRITNYVAGESADALISANIASNEYIATLNRDNKLQFLTLSPEERFEYFDSTAGKNYYDRRRSDKQFVLEKDKFSHQKTMDYWKAGFDIYDRLTRLPFTR